MKMHCYGQDANGNWKPLLVDAQGGIGGGSSLVPTSWRYAAGSGGIADTADVVLVAAAGANKSNYLKAMQIINTDATVGTECVVKDGSTVIWRGFSPASIAAVTQPSMVSIEFPIPLASSPNTALNFAAITNSAQLYVNAQGYQDATLISLQALASEGEEIFDDDGNYLTSDTGAQLYVS